MKAFWGGLRHGRTLAWILVAAIAALMLAGVTRADTDTTPPSLDNFSITPGSVNTYPTGGGVTWDATVSDADSGVASVVMTMTPTTAPQQAVTLHDAGGGDYSAHSIIYPTNEGTWTIDAIDVEDVAGNHHTYTSGDIEGLGFPTSFEVVNTPTQPVVTSFTPNNGVAGDSIGITGSSFTQATEVDFNGTASTSFTVNDDTSISADVPDGATTGKITVVGPGGQGVSASDFTVNGGGGGGGGTPTVELENSSGNATAGGNENISYRINPNGAFSTPQDVCLFSDDGSDGATTLNSDLSTPGGAQYDPADYPAYSTIEVDAGGGAAGDYALHVGLCDQSAISDVYTLTVGSGSTPTFAFSLDNQEFTTPAGSSITPNGTIDPDPDFTGTIDFSFNGATPNADINGEPWGQVLIPGPNSIDMPIDIGPDVDPGDYTIDVSASAEGLPIPDQHLSILVHVTAPLPSAFAGVYPTQVAQLDTSTTSVSSGDSFDGITTFYAQIQNGSTGTLEDPQITAGSDADPGFDPAPSSWPLTDGPGDSLVNAGDTFQMDELAGNGHSSLPGASVTANFDASISDGSIPAGGGDATATFDITPQDTGQQLDVEVDTQGPGFDYGPITDAAYPDTTTEDIWNEATSDGHLTFLIGNPIEGHTYELTVTVNQPNDGSDPVPFRPSVRARLGVAATDMLTADGTTISVPAPGLGSNGEFDFQSGNEVNWTGQRTDQTEVDFAGLPTTGGGGGGPAAVNGGVADNYNVTVDGSTDQVSGSADQSGDESWYVSMFNNSSDPSQTVDEPSITVEGSAGQDFDPPLDFPDTQSTDTLFQFDTLSVDDLASAVVHDQTFKTGLTVTRAFKSVACADTSACLDDPSSLDYSSGCPSATLPSEATTGYTAPTGDSLEVVTVTAAPTGGAQPDGEIDVSAADVNGDMADAGLSATLIGCDYSGVNGYRYDSAQSDGAHVGMTTDGTSMAVFVFQLSNGGDNSVRFKPEVDADSFGDVGSLATSEGTEATIHSDSLGSDVDYSAANDVSWNLQNSLGYSSTMNEYVYSIIPTAPDGSGSITASPANVVTGSTGNTIVFTYTADPDADAGLNQGSVTLQAPTGWTPPQVDDSTADGYVNTDIGSASVSGSTITVSGLDMSPGDQLNITYGDTSDGGGGAAAPTGSGAQTWHAQEQSNPDGALTTLTAGEPTVALTAPDGSGTMTASPTAFRVGDTGKSIAFTYTADTGGLTNGTVAVVVPGDWTPPSADPGPGHVSSNKGETSVGDDGQTVYVTGLNLTQGQTVTITYANAGPDSSGAEDWEALEQSDDFDGTHATITDLAAFPSISVVAPDGSGSVDVSDEQSNDPPLIPKGSSGHTLTFTYTADDGGLANGTVVLTIPAGWPAPTADTTKAALTTYTGSGSDDSVMSIKKQVLTVSGLNMAGGDQFTIVYGDTASDVGTGVKAPAKTGNPDWTTTEQSLPAPAGKATKLAVQPKVPVVGKPKVGGFTPPTAAIGATITIKGADLAGVDNPNTGGIEFSNPDLGTSDADLSTAVVNAAGTAVTVALPEDISPGKWQVQVTNDSGIGSDPVDSGTSALSSAKLTVVDTAEVDEVDPSDAAVGKTIVLNGLNLKGTSLVWFTGGANGVGVSVKPAKVTATAVTVKVPAGAITGSVWTVTNSAPSNEADFTVDYVTPVIKAVAPAVVAVTATITITGSHFTGVQDTDNGGDVSVGGESIDPSLITWVSDAKIIVPVPADLDPGVTPVVVTNGGGSSLAKNITIVAPTITAVAPTSTKVGKAVKITGTNLKGATLVTFTGGKTAKPSKVSADGTSVTVTVPKGTQTGSFQISVAGVKVDSGAVVLTIL